MGSPESGLIIEARSIVEPRESVVGSLKPPDFLQRLRREALKERYRKGTITTLAAVVGLGFAATKILRKKP